MHRIAAALISCSLLACASPTLDVGVNYGQYSLDGNLGFGSGGVSGVTPLDGIGLGEDDNPVGITATIGLGSPMLVFSATTPSFEGDGTLSADIDIDGTIINAGANVHSQLEVGMLQGLLLFEMVPGSTVDFALGLGVNMLDLSGNFTEDGTGTEVVLDQALPIPVLAGRVGVEAGPVGLSALVTWIGISYEDNDLDAMDLDLRAEMGLFGPMVGYAGYRNTSLDIFYQDGADFGKFDVTISGVYFGVGVSF
jgi:hypothetical protein